MVRVTAGLNIVRDNEAIRAPGHGIEPPRHEFAQLARRELQSIDAETGVRWTIQGVEKSVGFGAEQPSHTLGKKRRGIHKGRF